MFSLRPLFAVLLLIATAFGPARANDGAAVKPAAKVLATKPVLKPAKSAARPTQAAKSAVRPAALVLPAAPVKPAEARFAITVSGSIINADGLPLAGATVWNSRSHEVLAVTNAEGEFLVNLPTNAPVTLTCGYAGCTDEKIELERPHRLNEVVVSLLSGPVRPRR